MSSNSLEYQVSHYFSQASFFSSLKEDALQFLADTITPCEPPPLSSNNVIIIVVFSPHAVLFSTGEAVYNEGEMPTYVFLVLKGS